VSLSAAPTNVHKIPKHSTQRGEKVVIKEEYFLILADSAEFASLQTLLEEVNTLDEARASEQVKSQSNGKPCLQGIDLRELCSKFCSLCYSEFPKKLDHYAHYYSFCAPHCYDYSIIFVTIQHCNIIFS